MADAGGCRRRWCLQPFYASFTLAHLLLAHQIPLPPCAPAVFWDPWQPTPAKEGNANIGENSAFELDARTRTSMRSQILKVANIFLDFFVFFNVLCFSCFVAGAVLCGPCKAHFVAGAGLCGPWSAELVAGAGLFVGLEVQISWQV